ncbi:MAG: M15 family metallopeptidase [Tannerellaceae bacterium]|jgi:D-alanyl-D-alanine dipeptidase|nr:M15 family metallopeptidase [Tannerellaceae bacterium]
MKKLYCLAALALSVFLAQAQTDELDLYLSSHGMVNVSRMDSSLMADFKYATDDNFMGRAVYRGLTSVWLHPDAANKLLKASDLLKNRRKGYRLLVYDAARPMFVQRQMWDLVKRTAKVNYVSNPANGGGLHNYGMAVDITIVDPSGRLLDMGTAFDFFGEEAHINNEDYLLNTGKISHEAYLNRRLLRGIMREAGFTTIIYEWWHFNACSRNVARRDYRVIE